MQTRTTCISLALATLLGACGSSSFNDIAAADANLPGAEEASSLTMPGEKYVKQAVGALVEARRWRPGGGRLRRLRGAGPDGPRQR